MSPINFLEVIDSAEVEDQTQNSTIYIKEANDTNATTTRRICVTKTQAVEYKRDVNGQTSGTADTVGNVIARDTSNNYKLGPVIMQWVPDYFADDRTDGGGARGAWLAASATGAFPPHSHQTSDEGFIAGFWE